MKYLSILFFLILFLIPYFPRLDSIDIIGAHWFYLSILNLIFFIPVSVLNTFNSITQYLNIPFFKSYIFFVLLAILSLFYSNNLNVSLVDLSRIFLTLITLVYCLIFLHHINIKNVLYLILSSLLIDFIFVYYYIFEYFFLNTFSILDFQSVYKESLFRGFSGNKNIMATFLLLKLPVVVYLFYRSSFKSLIFYIPFFILFFITIFLLKSRASFLSLSLVIILTLFFYSYNFKKFFFKQISIVFSLIFSYIIFTYVLFSDSENSSILSEVRSIQISAESSNHRFLLWENAINYISKHPLFGAGIGNWKIESAPYWKTELSDFIVPYHAHNDFLELTTELGILGGLTYFSIFCLIFFSLLKRIAKSPRTSNFHFLLLSFFIIYFIDAFLNFPMERTIIQILFSFFFSLLLFNTKKLADE